MTAWDAYRPMLTEERKRELEKTANAIRQSILHKALLAARALVNEHFDVEVLNLSAVKPLDMEAIIAARERTRCHRPRTAHRRTSARRLACPGRRIRPGRSVPTYRC